MRPIPVHDRLAAALRARREEPFLADEAGGAPLTPEQRRALRDRGARVIEDGLRALGAPDPAALQDENGFFHFRLGTIRCTLGIITVEERDLFLTYAPIMDLPSDRDLILPLYRLLLELNNRFEMSVAKFGLHGDTVFLSAMRPLEGLDAVEARQIVTWVSHLADQVDQRLIAEFGGTTKARGCQPPADSG